MASIEKPITFPYANLNELLLDYVKYTDFECSNKVKLREIFHQDIKSSTTLLRRPSPMRNKGYSDNNSLTSCDAGLEDGQKLVLWQVTLV
ncbi:unnamed protein product [Schistosoma curassoni]|uniref:LisH domain-containing protein n=1 Tax=Schistosoma curassoni TaxID=6186 RepID=A0A183JXE4_9TREM|nr:unnamed protein product [Schistosoma curassoni]